MNYFKSRRLILIGFSIVFFVYTLSAVLVYHIDDKENDKYGPSEFENQESTLSFDQKELNTSSSDIEASLIEYSDKVYNSCNYIFNSNELEVSINSWEFLVNHQFKLIYCPIFKAASSTWLYNFLLMKRVRIPQKLFFRDSPVAHARTYYPRPNLEGLQNILNDNYTSFLIVRDPFTRLLSAYKDKLEKQKELFFHKLRCKIAKIKKCKPTFSEFVDYVISEEINQKLLNEHWTPYHKFCSPCQVHFDYILRFENLEKEEDFLFHQIPDLSSILKSRNILHSSNTNYTGELNMYYNQLTSDQLNALIEVYRKDFELFGYDYEKYRNRIS